MTQITNYPWGSEIESVTTEQVAAPAATDKQVAYIRSLLGKRVAPAGFSQDELAVITRADASALIDTLLSQPYIDRASRAVPNTAPTRHVADGIYTVSDGSNGWVTLKVDTPDWAGGKRVIGALVGPDNELSYKNFAFLTASGVTKWRSANVSERTVAATQFLLTGDLDEARAKFLDLAEAHAISSGNCLACLRTLTVPASVHRGLGPVCAKRLGVA